VPETNSENVVKDPVTEVNGTCSKKFNHKKTDKILKNIFEYLCTTHISFEA
jgi:hypothetical protein